ncbi:MAG: hypothetical protein ABEI06_03610 [Halobacteriaceae archaeon]
MHISRIPQQIQIGLGSAIREFVREPVNLGLLIALPPIVIISYGSMMAAFPKLPFMTTSPQTLGTINGTMYVAAFLPGVIGLFQVISALRADERLAIVGFPRSIMFVSRMLTVFVASLLTASIAMVVLNTQTTVARPLAGLGILLLVGNLYGLIGMIVGSILPRELEGSLVLIFVADIDEALASGIVRTDVAFTKLFPLHYPHDLFKAVVSGSGIEISTAIMAGSYWIVLVFVTLIVYTFVTGQREML